jgi:hypothetical protein
LRHFGHHEDYTWFDYEIDAIIPERTIRKKSAKQRKISMAFHEWKGNGCFGSGYLVPGENE